MATRSVDPPPDGLPRPGDVVAGRYQLVRQLGGGGMGVVFEAVQSGLGRRVAVKFIRPEALSSRTALERFEREARACAAIAHPHVVEVYDFGRSRRAAFMVMPLLDGESLGDRLKRLGRLPVESAVAVMIQVLDGLHAAHERGVIHRDVKGDNVFLVRTVDGEVARVLDFGIAHDASADEPLTREGDLLGTPAYMSPEQASGLTGIDRRTDVYSAGALLHHLVAGRKPFPQEGVLAVLDAVRAGDREPLSRHAPGVPPELESIVDRAMARSPDGRFATAREFAAALRGLKLDGRAEPPPERPSPGGVAATPPGVALAARLSGALRPPRKALPLLGAAALSAVVAAAIARGGPDGRHSPAAREDTHSRAGAAVVARAATGGAGPPDAGLQPVPGVAAPLDATAPREATATFVLVVRTEDEAVVTVPGTPLRAVASVRREGELARVTLRVPSDRRRVCCAIRHEAEPVCSTIALDEEGRGHADCFAR